MTSRAVLVLALVAAPLGALLGACQHDITTPFPPGLEPLEPDIAPEPADMTTEVLSTATGSKDYIRVYGKGYVLAAPAVVWAATKGPDQNVAVCSTSSHTVDVANEPEYEYSFLVHYEVDNFLTVKWDDQWRWGVIEGTDADPMLGMIKHQKVQGSSFINLSEGTLEILPTPDPNVTELDFVEHLDATSAGTSDVVAGMQHHYKALVAVTHGNPIPPCP